MTSAWSTVGVAPGLVGADAVADQVVGIVPGVPPGPSGRAWSAPVPAPHPAQASATSAIVVSRRVPGTAPQ
jgi:hypothetical protein